MKVVSYGQRAAVAATSNIFYFLSLYLVSCTEESVPPVRLHEENPSVSVPEIIHQSRQESAPGEKVVEPRSTGDEQFFDGGNVEQSAESKPLSRLRRKKKSTSSSGSRKRLNVVSGVSANWSKLLSAVTVALTVVFLWRFVDFFLKCLGRVEARAKESGAPGSTARLLGDSSESREAADACADLVPYVASSSGGEHLPLTPARNGDGGDEVLLQGGEPNVEAPGSADKNDGLISALTRRPLLLRVVLTTAFLLIVLGVGLGVGVSEHLRKGDHSSEATASTSAPLIETQTSDSDSSLPHPEEEIHLITMNTSCSSWPEGRACRVSIPGDGSRKTINDTHKGVSYVMSISTEKLELLRRRHGTERAGLWWIMHSVQEMVEREKDENYTGIISYEILTLTGQ